MGISTSALNFGGGGTVNNEKWNGTNWTEVNNLNTARDGNAGGAGTTAAGLAFGGKEPSPAVTGNTELWNGTNWTEVNNMNDDRRQLVGTGTQTSALAFGGEDPGTGSKTSTESCNGTVWNNVEGLSTGRVVADGSGASNTSALCFGGATALTATEEWDGTGFIVKTLTTTSDT